MIKITDQYFWNLVFLVFFGAMVVMGVIILETESRIPLSELSFFDITIIILASWRLVYLIAYENITKFFREQFYDLKKTGRAFSLQKPKYGPRRTLVDLITSPSSLGLWMTASVTFFYLVTPYALYLFIFMALSAVVTLFQLGVEAIGGSQEKIE
jgi:hypothetical protein